MYPLIELKVGLADSGAQDADETSSLTGSGTGRLAIEAHGRLVENNRSHRRDLSRTIG